MTEPLRSPRAAAHEVMASAVNSALGALGATADTALSRAVEALASASTQEEIDRIRDVFVSSIANFGSTRFVTRSR